MADRAERLTVEPAFSSEETAAPLGAGVHEEADVSSGVELVVESGQEVSKRSHRGRFAAIAGAGAVLAALVLGVQSGISPATDPSKVAGPATLIVQPQPLVSRVTLVGSIEAGRMATVVAPFDGIIKEKMTDYGAQVDAGQVVLVMDTFDLEVRIREAQSAYLKAAQSVETLVNWGASAEVARARRRVSSVELTLKDVERKLRETKSLLERGIVPRMEYDGLEQQLRQQEMEAAAAKRDLETVLEQSSPGHRRIAALELQNARDKLDDLRGQLDHAIIEAPASGLVLRLSRVGPDAASSGQVEVGTRVIRGQRLLNIAMTEALAVAARIDEVDINRIREGQVAEVTADALGTDRIMGRIASIAAQATPDAGSTRAARFEVKIELPSVTEEQRRRLRIGMSCTVAVEVYRNPAALILPAAAIRSSKLGPSVRIRKPETGLETDVPVIVGETTEAGIEIRSGLVPGDLVLLQ